MNFTEYLAQKKLSDRTIIHYTKSIGQFLSWLHEEDIRDKDFTYTDLLEFMHYCQQHGSSKQTVHHLLCIIRHYCNYLISRGKRSDNPAAGVFIKGLVRKLPTNLLSIEAMEELYQQYSVQLHVDASKKIMLGLMIYQGVTVSEIMKLQSHHCKLKDGKILIKGTKRTNERLLDLKAIQIPLLQQYLDANKFKEGALFIERVRKVLSSGEDLGGAERNINNRIKYMFDQLRKLQPKVINAKQIRSSVITEWLRKNNLRQVQYMAGHKYVSSTERYQTSSLDDLQSELQEHHPGR